MMQIIARAIDCFEPLSADYARSLKANGYAAAARYLGQVTNGLSKALKPSEVQAIHSAGLRIISIWELNPTYKAYFTAAQGTKDGSQAAADAKALGQPAGTAIYFTVDFDAQDSDLPAIRSYLAAVKAAVGPYKVGIYGGYRVIANVAADYYWQTAAWSGGATSPRNNILQNTFNTTVNGRNVDIDVIYKDPGWWPASTPSTPEVTTRVSYPSYNVLVNGHVFKAIAVNNVTYVLWTAAKYAGSVVTDPVTGDGKLTVNGKVQQGVIYEGDTYLPWAGLGDQVQAEKIEWNFNVTNQTTPSQ